MDPELAGDVAQKAIEASSQGNPWPLIALTIIASVVGVGWLVDKAWWHAQRRRANGDGNGTDKIAAAIESGARATEALGAVQIQLVDLSKTNGARLAELERKLDTVCTQAKINGERLNSILREARE